MTEAVSRPELVLGSASPYRRQMLAAAGLAFRVEPAAIDEPAFHRGLANKTPSAVAEMLARAKAQEVSARFPDALTGGADQVLALGEELLHKPGDIATARAHLLRLRGKTHELHSGVAVARGGRAEWSCVARARLTMHAFSEAFLESYLSRFGGKVCGIVGAYEIEGPGIQLFERIEGDHFTIVGLPLLPLLAQLRSYGVVGT
jgi:septum formation protein